MTDSVDPYRPSGTVALRHGRQSAVERGHPWIYRGALDGPLPTRSGPVTVLAHGGGTLGVALPGEPGGSLALRLLTRSGETWDRETLARRLVSAATLRRDLAIDADAYRLVHAEGDRLPGLVVDLYAGHAVVQPFAPAWWPYLDDIAQLLVEHAGCGTVLLRPPASASATPLRGALPAGPVVVREGCLRLPADLLHGQKTGLFLDQRDNRRRFGALTGGRTVLNLFSYSGGFAVAARAAGALRAVSVDASAEALRLAREAARLNGQGVDEDDFVQGNAFEVCRDLAAAGQRFGAAVVDPPAFVKKRSDLHQGLKAYRDINRQALRVIAAGGLVLSCSCSALVGEEQFVGALLAAALEAGRELRVLGRYSAGPDHPVLLACPETRHLQAWLCHVA